MNVNELIQQKPWADGEIPFGNVPNGMLGFRESLLCYYLAKGAFTGAGTIVDAGSFLGRSAYFFAQGLRENPNYNPERHRIHCFDNFLVNEGGTVEFMRVEFGKTVVIGDSTREVFEANVAPVRGMLDVHAGDFQTIHWPPEPIEILFVDIAKNVALSSRVAEVFLPNLIPGKSVLIQQDYHHPWLPHIHVTMEYLADYFELAVPRADDSAMFRCVAPIPKDVLQRVIDYDFTYEEQLALMDAAIARLDEDDRFYVSLARIILRRFNTAYPILQQEFSELEARFKERPRDYTWCNYFDQVRHAIDDRVVWGTLAEGDYDRCVQVADRVLEREQSVYMMAARGHALIELGRYSEAEQQLRKAVQGPPVLGYSYIQLARAMAAQKLFTEAEAELLAALRGRKVEIEPESVLDGLAIVWEQEGTPHLKAPVMESLHRERPGDPELWVLESRLAMQRGDMEHAEKSLETASSLGLSPLRIERLRYEIQLCRHPEVSH